MSEGGGIMNKNKLLKNALIKFAVGVMGVGLILFVSAGTLAWWSAWVFMAVLFRCFCNITILMQQSK